MIVTLKGQHKTGRVWINGELLDPKPSQELLESLPRGFNWGYGGSGPAQLALAVLLKFTDRRTAVENYQLFKWEIIAQLEQDADFEIDVNLNPWIQRRETIA